jgi:hypothetical protein
MKTKMFDNQHQKMSTWLEKLANDESSNFSESDLDDENIVEKLPVEYNGISSTWNAKKEISPIALDDTSRRVSNKSEIPETIDDIEKQARQLLMTGLNIEKLSTVLKRKFSKQLVDNFMQIKIASIEEDFGKLGCTYVDASLVNDCNDLAQILDVNNKISSIAISNVKKIAKCDDCNCNKKSHCVKLGLDIIDQPVIKTVKEAKSIINKFASLKYVNSYFIKTEELTKYYSRLASENPDKVVKSFLIDIENRRQAKQSINTRLAAKETIANAPKEKVSTIKFGKEDIETANAFKQFLLQDQSLRTAKSVLSKRYGEERVKVYLKEARADIEKYIKFVTAKTKNDTCLRHEANESDTAEIKNKQSIAKIASAIKMAYLLRTFRQPLNDIEKNIAKTYGHDIAKNAINKLSNDNEARLLGLTYIDSNLYSNANEIKDVLNILKRKSSTIFQIKEGNACKIANNPEGICSITGLTIVKDASASTYGQSEKIMSQLQNMKFANDYELKKIASNFVNGDNSNLIANFIASQRPSKMISSRLVRNAADIALKYAKDLQTIRKIAKMQWPSTNLLVEALESNVVNKQAFINDVNGLINRSASDANVYLNQPNQYNVATFDENKNDISDVTLGFTI